MIALASLEGTITFWAQDQKSNSYECFNSIKLSPARVSCLKWSDWYPVNHGTSSVQRKSKFFILVILEVFFFETTLNPIIMVMMMIRVLSHGWI